jgi:hypothetical protein
VTLYGIFYKNSDVINMMLNQHQQNFHRQKEPSNRVHEKNMAQIKDVARQIMTPLDFFLCHLH